MSELTGTCNWCGSTLTTGGCPNVRCYGRLGITDLARGIPIAVPAPPQAEGTPPDEPMKCPVCDFWMHDGSVPNGKRAYDPTMRCANVDCVHFGQSFAEIRAVVPAPASPETPRVSDATMAWLLEQRAEGIDVHNGVPVYSVRYQHFDAVIRALAAAPSGPRPEAPVEIERPFSEHACLTGDCDHVRSAGCDAALAAEYRRLARPAPSVPFASAPARPEAPAGSGEPRYYRKKPVVIRAYQMLLASDAREGVCTGGISCPKHGPEGAHPHIHTLEGDHTWTPGDWVIRGIKGEFYFCKPDIFAETYDDGLATPPAVATGAGREDGMEHARVALTAVAHVFNEDGDHAAAKFCLAHRDAIYGGAPRGPLSWEMGGDGAALSRPGTQGATDA